MGFYTWSSAAGDGTWTNNAYSTKLRREAISDSLGMQFVSPEAGYGLKKGESLDLFRFNALTVPTDGTLNETLDIPIDKMSNARTRITVAEWGRGVEVTSKAVDLTFFQLEDMLETQLKEQMTKTLDRKIWAIFKACQVKYIPTGVASAVWDTDGTASTAALSNINVWHLGKIRDYMRDTLIVPYYGNQNGLGYYVGMFSTKALRGIKLDPRWVEFQKHADAVKGLNGVIAMIENILIMENNDTTSFPNNSGTGSVLGEGVIFGADPVAMIVARDPELRYATAGYGRFKGVVWYGELQFGEVRPIATAGHARIVHIASS